MQLETIKPSNGAFAPLDNPLENLVQMYPLIATNKQKGAVYEAYTCTFPKKTLLYENNKRYNHRILQFLKAIVRYCPGKEVPVSEAYLFNMEVFEKFLVGTVEHYHYDDYLRV